MPYIVRIDQQEPYAVATLDEAQEAGDHADVQRVDWPRLFTLAVESNSNLKDSASEAEIIDAYNAR